MPLSAAEIFGASNRWLGELLAAGEPANFRTTIERSEVFEVVVAGATRRHSGGRHRRNERAGSPATWQP